MIFQVISSSGLAFQPRVSVPVNVATVTTSTEDFKAYQSARHQPGLTAESLVNQKNPIYTTAKTLLEKEAKDIKKTVELLSAVPKDDPSFEYSSKMLKGARQNLLIAESALDDFKTAKKIGEIDAAVRAADPVRVQIHSAPDAQLPALLALFEKQKALQNHMSETFKLYKSLEAAAFHNDLVGAPLGSQTPAAPAPTESAKLPPVPTATKKDPVADLNLPDSYAQRVADLKKTGPENEAAATRKIALRHVIGLERAFLLALEDKTDPSVSKQLKQLESKSPGVTKTLEDLTAKYKAVTSTTTEAQKLTLSQEFRERLSSHGAGLDGIATAKENPNTIAAAIIKITDIVDKEALSQAKGLDTEAAKAKKTEADAERKQELQRTSATDAPTATGFPWVDKCRIWAFENGFVDTRAGSVKIRDINNKNNPLAEKEISELEDGSKTFRALPSSDPVVAYKAVVAARIEIEKLFGEKPKLKYGQPQDFLNPVAKGLNFITTIGFGNTLKNPNQVIDGLRNDNQFKQLLAKLENEERELERFVEYNSGAKEKFKRKEIAEGVDPARENASAKARAPLAVALAATVVERAAKSFYISTEADVVRPGGGFVRRF